MKGISAILATVLIVVITVAIIGMAYGWATGLFKFTTGAASSEAESQIVKMQKSVEIMSTKCANSTNPDIYIAAIGGGDVIPPQPEYNILTFTVKNKGTANIASGELSAFMNETDIDSSFSATGDDIKTTSLNEGEIKEFVYQNIDIHTDYRKWNLKVVAPAGYVEQEVTCTPVIY